MKRFETFGEYMFDLLFAPLKKGRRTVNQFAIFFRVIGREFEDLKAAIFRVRDEANVASASAVMLPVHGQDRNMPRLEGEDAEAYRTRLSMKGIIFEWGGTRKGIRYALTSLGYEQSSVEPVYGQDPERWAEFIVHLGVGKQNSIINFFVIFDEIQRVKEASSRLACIVFTAFSHAAGALTVAEYYGQTAVGAANVQKSSSGESYGDYFVVGNGDPGFSSGSMARSNAFRVSICGVYSGKGCTSMTSMVAPSGRM